MDVISFPENMLTTSGLSIYCMALLHSQTRRHMIIVLIAYKTIKGSGSLYAITFSHMTVYTKLKTTIPTEIICKFLKFESKQYVISTFIINRTFLFSITSDIETYVDPGHLASILTYSSTRLID